MAAYCNVKSVFGGLFCYLSNTDLEASETPEGVAGHSKTPLKTIKALLEPVLRTKVQEVPMVDPVEPVDPTDSTDPTDTISTASTASYKSIIG